MNTIVVIVFALLFALVTFFGLGPVLIADGSIQERMLTLLVVLLLYAVMGYALHRFLTRSRKKD